MRSVFCELKLSRSVRSPFVGFVFVADKSFVRLLIRTGLRKAVPLHLRECESDSKMIFDLENYRCRHYYSTLIKFIYERPKKWVMLTDRFNLTEEQPSSWPKHTCYHSMLRLSLMSVSFKVLNCILFTNDLLFKIGYIANPNCSFCNEALETTQHFLFCYAISQAFWNDVIYNILKKFSSCRYLLLSDVIGEGGDGSGKLCLTFRKSLVMGL